MNVDFINFLSATRPAWVTESFPIIRLVIIILMAVLSLFLILIILIQPSNSQGVGALTGQSDTYYSKNKTKNLEGVMKRLTVITSIVMLVLTIAFFVSLIIYAGG